MHGDDIRVILACGVIAAFRWSLHTADVRGNPEDGHIGRMSVATRRMAT